MTEGTRPGRVEPAAPDIRPMMDETPKADLRRRLAKAAGQVYGVAVTRRHHVLNAAIGRGRR